MNYVIGIRGDNKSGKTTLALTFPKPMAYFELDIGGYFRASHRFDTSQIQHKQYLMPMDDMVMGFTGTKGFKKGYREIWETFAQDFMLACINPDIQTIVVDSFPQLYTLSNNTIWQEKEEAKGKLIERLMPLDYAPSYERMQKLIYWARTSGKTLVLTHFLTDEYQDIVTSKGELASRKTGKKVTAGWSKIDKELDLMVECWYDPQDKCHKAKIVLSGLAREALGQIISEPTWEMIEAMVMAFREIHTYAPH